MYQIILTANGDYISGEVKSIHDLIKVFETEDHEEYDFCVEGIDQSSDSGRQKIFELAKKEEFDLTKYLSGEPEYMVDCD